MVRIIHRHRPDGAELINTKASIPASFHFDELGLKVISSEISHRDSTLSTLYGNDAARKTALTNSGLHSKGELFAFVTWKQQQDKEWFGAIAPAELKPDTLGNQDRVTCILRQKPFVLP